VDLLHGRPGLISSRASVVVSGTVGSGSGGGLLSSGGGRSGSLGGRSSGLGLGGRENTGSIVVLYKFPPSKWTRRTNDTRRRREIDVSFGFEMAGSYTERGERGEGKERRRGTRVFAPGLTSEELERVLGPDGVRHGWEVGLGVEGGKFIDRFGRV
jgi:hypothetical protein